MPSVNAIDISESMTLNDKAVASYLGMAIGDALGATNEFLTETEIITKHGLHKDIKGGGWLRLKPGQVTDDTTMALALGDAILAGRTICAFDIAQAFSDWMKSKPIDIGNTVRRGIMNFRYSDTPYVEESDMDAGNGACMRTLPIALATYGQDRAQVTTASRIQAHVTHHNKLSDAGTECIIFCIQGLLSGDNKNEIQIGPVSELIINYPVFDYHQTRISNPSGYIVDTLQTVFQSFFSTSSFEECLIEVVNRGGDADTTGAIAGMLAGAYYGTEAIPVRWLKNLETETRKVCEQQATDLLNKSNLIQIDTMNTRMDQ